MVNPTGTVDSWVQDILSGEADLTNFPDQHLQDLIGCLEARQTTPRIDDCVGLFVAAAAKHVATGQYSEARELAREIGADLSAWSNEELAAAMIHKKRNYVKP